MKIARRGREEQAIKRQKKEVTAETVLDELAAVAFSNAADFVEVTGEGRVRVKPTARIPRAKRAAIVGIRASSGGIEIKLANKMQALQLLGRYLGAFEPEAAVEDLEQARLEVFGDEQAADE